MKITLDIEDNEAGKGLFYWILLKEGAKSLPIGSASQWYYEVGKALWEISDEEVERALRDLSKMKHVTISDKEAGSGRSY